MKQGSLLSHLRSPADEHLVVCALPNELPEMLPERVLFTGVGKINAIVSDVIQFGTEGSICRTQDQFCTNIDTLDLFQHLVNDNKFNVVDMEAYALAKVCTHLHVDFHCYKYVSDDANETADTDWQENISKGEPLFYDVLREYFNFVHIQ